MLPAGLTCLNDVAAGSPSDDFTSVTSCQAFKASQRLIKPGEPFKTGKQECFVESRMTSSQQEKIQNKRPQ